MGGFSDASRRGSETGTRRRTVTTLKTRRGPPLRLHIGVNAATNDRPCRRTAQKRREHSQEWLCYQAYRM
jgi:hypothetical protein